MQELKETQIIELGLNLILEINPDEEFEIRKKKSGDKVIDIREFKDCYTDKNAFILAKGDNTEYKKSNEWITIYCRENGDRDNFSEYFVLCSVWKYAGVLWINPEYDPRVVEKRKEKERIENDKKKKIKAFLEMMKGGEDYSNEIMELI